MNKKEMSSMVISAAITITLLQIFMSPKIFEGFSSTTQYIIIFIIASTAGILLLIIKWLDSKQHSQNEVKQE